MSVPASHLSLRLVAFATAGTTILAGSRAPKDSPILAQRPEYSSRQGDCMYRTGRKINGGQLAGLVVDKVPEKALAKLCIVLRE